VFLDRVRVPRANLIGRENEGWQIAQVTLAHERGANYAIKEQVLARIALDELLAEARASGAAADPRFRQELARLQIATEIMRFMNLQMLSRVGRGITPGLETSVVKQFWSDLSQALGEASVQALGPHGILLRGSRHARAGGRFAQRMLFSRASTIAGGTAEIQRNIIAQRLLGLPRS